MPLSLKAPTGLHSLKKWKAPSTCYGTLISMLNPVKGRDIYDVERSFADLVETGKSQKLGWAPENS